MNCPMCYEMLSQVSIMLNVNGKLTCKSCGHVHASMGNPYICKCRHCKPTKKDGK